ncbi:MAG: hypothetical protein MCSN_0950 [Candidatus Microsyncoccus archaeolyticus]|nr:MAG: hypothetical protein MCSN_0950 [Candidatus Parcubacteria bacterium]
MNSVFDFQEYGYVIIGLSVLIFSLIFIWIFLSKLFEKKRFKESLSFVLFSVRIPPKTEEELRQSGKNEKDWIKLMEDFYNSLISLRKQSFLGVLPWISLEIAKVRDEIGFYVSVPKEFETFIEKKIYSIFPDAQIEKTVDFNIFGEKEEVNCGYFKLQKPLFLPIKTYNYSETDPLSIITNVLTKLEEKEEAVVQIVLRNVSSSWQIRAKAIINEVNKGKSFSSALMETSSLNIFKSQDKKETEKIIKKDEELLKALEEKISKQGFETNIRVVVSIKDKKKSDDVFSQIINAFDQFSDSKINGFSIIRVYKSKLKDFLYDYSFRLFNPKQSIILNSEELTSIFHFPTPFLKTPNIKALKSKTSPPPVNIPKQGILLGFSEYREEKKEIRIKREDRRRHLYIIGQTGTGKSSFLSNLIEQDVLSKEGVGILDPHGDLIEDILGKIPKERIEDVVIFDPASAKRAVGLNMLEYDPRFPEQKTFIINELISIFDKLYDLRQTGGPMFEQYTRNALMLLMDDPSETYTLLEVPKVFTDENFRKYLLSKCRNNLVKDFWIEQAEKAGGETALKNMGPYITSKFDTFIQNDFLRPILGQIKSTFNFREILDEKKIFLVNLSKGRIGEKNSELLGLIIASKLAMAAFSRIEIEEEKRNDFYLYIDEFHNFATESISTILSEARKYRLCLTVSHQFIGQLIPKIRESIFGNVGTIISFRIGAEDAEFVKKEFESVFSMTDLISIDNFNFYIRPIIDGQTTRPFNVKTYPPTKGDKERAWDIKEYYSLTYGRDRELVDEEINKRTIVLKEKIKYNN